MFQFLNKKSKKFIKAWEEKKPAELEVKEKILYTLAGKIQAARLARPGEVSISPEEKNRIRENFYHKYFNLVGSKATAKNLINEQTRTQESRKEIPMTLPFNLSRVTLALAGAAVVVIALALGIYFTRGPAGNFNGALAAHLSVADGQVEIWNGSEWKPVAVGVTLAGQSQLRTGESSKAVLEFDEGSALRLDENTHVILEEINNKNISVTQVVGETYSRVNKTSGLTYKVKSSDTETTALGTAFGVATENSNWVKKGEKKVIVKVVESKVKVKIVKNDETLEKEVSEGEELIVDMTKPIEDTAKKIPLPKEETAQDGFYAWNRTEDSEKSYPLGVLSDVTAPEINIREPLDGIETELLRVAVRGTTEAGAKVFVNGALAENKDGSFEKIIDLKVGGNKIAIKAKDDSGNATTKEITVTRKGEAVQALPLYLKGWVGADGINLSWSLSGITAPKGFKLVKSLTAYPTYPGDSAIYLNPDTKSYLWQVNDGKVWHFRICIYEGGACGTYSNDLKLTAKSNGAASGEVYGTLALTGWIKTGRMITLSWALSGNSPYGYKLVKSLEPNPVYPGNEYVYLSSPDMKGSYTWDVVDPGTYHFRVCAYNGGGGCVFYSNDYSVTVQ
ncbi:FecR domain-containing protein [Candidatus Falkowbacteria bacterium]|nr:FecR domain-containing protein [Candidatus Falkowbacteria bacterium]